MLVASNTSPVCNLAIVGHLNLLRIQFAEVLIPIAVKNELGQVSHSDAARDVQRALSEGWIKPEAVREATVVRLLQATLDLGEAEVIALALEVSANLVLLDERDARAAAERAGLRSQACLACCYGRR